MVSNSKILTVSYGTFSCTLEGFDEPFGTMKSIAEYFRDLAADDRYFGAEPPTPDAEMLHRIAEREVQKRVEARVENDGIVLRQEGASLPAVTKTGATVVAGQALLETDDADGADAEDTAEVEAAPVAKAPVADRAPAQEDTAAAPVAEVISNNDDGGDTDSVAAKLSRIRAVVDAEDEGDIVEHDNAASFFAEETGVDNTVAEETADAPIETVIEAVGVEDKSENQDGTFEDLDTPDVAEPEQADSSDDEDEVFEDLPAETAQEDAQPGEKETSATKADDDAASPLILSNTVPEGTDDGVNAILSQLEAQNTNTDAETQTYEDTDVEVSVSDGITNVLENAFDDDPAPLRPVGRVVRVKRLRRDDGSEELAVAKNTVLDGDAPTEVDQSEATLQAELADVEAETATAESDDENSTQELLSMIDHEVKTEARRERRDQAFDAGVVDQSEDTLDRILAETNDKMDSQEVSRRRNSIEHLKAAVQAKRADEEAGEDGELEQEEDPYREDLARAVRPRRPDNADADATSRRMAPLVLVSEQRIDDTDEVSTGSSEDAAPAAAVTPTRVIRPRRVNRDATETKAEDEDSEANVASVIESDSAAKAVSADPSQDGFAAYVNGADASDMTGLMEAAASYATKVQGLPQFSRPHIMRLVMGLKVNGGISREEALRAFGRLLREGRILKIAPGRFALADADKSQDGRQTA